jgi:hypothetical protein
MTRRRIFRFAIALLGVAAIFALASCIDILRSDPCCDFIVRRGFPFGILERGGFAGIHKYLPIGIAANCAAAVAVAALIERRWSRPAASNNESGGA